MIRVFETDLGWMGVAVSGGKIQRVVLPLAERRAVQWELRNCGEGGIEGKRDKLLADRLEQDLKRHMGGEPVDYSDYILDTRNYSRFRVAVWDLVRLIPFGSTRSYKEIALQIGHSDSARAVGAAMGANPFPPIVPCHRVVGSDGSLTGFSRGLPLKQMLLELEQQQKAVNQSKV